jgi:glycosyltransferase involved in cell wall biosynthesis
LESLACGTPVVASDIAALREVGADAATYCAVGDVEAWTDAIHMLLDERQEQPAEWAARQQRGVRRAEAFSWSKYAREIASLYERMVDGSAVANERASEPTREEWGSRGPTSARAAESEGRSPSE